jgi:hypothetical protein
MALKPTKTSINRISLNVGACLDIPTATTLTGAKGETIINGGLPSIMAIVGPGNSYKSTILHYYSLSAYNRTIATAPSSIHTYDTEINIVRERLNHLSKGFEYVPEDIALTDDDWNITDKANYGADEWFQLYKESIDEKIKDKKQMTELTAFKDRYTGKTLTVPDIDIVEIDSLTELESDSTVDMLMASKTDNSDTNTLFMKQGLYKTKMLSSLPRLCNISNTYMLLTAHVAEKIDMATGPAKYNQPTKKMQYLKTADNIKGVTSKFNFLTSLVWMAHTASTFNNKTTRTSEYPLENAKDDDKELNLVRLTPLRSKTGASGYTLELLVSQHSGVLPTLTEFHNIKSNDKFGMLGNNIHYSLVLKPDVSLSRTTVRTKIRDDKKLRRAINITSELLQISKYMLQFEDIICTPEELYKDLIDLGYDWDILLDTRGWWTPDQYSDKIEPFLSTIDLLRMRQKEYKPYWYTGELKY